VAKFVPGPVPLGNVVREFNIGNTRVIVCSDAYEKRSRAEQLQSIDNIGRIWGEAERNRILKEALNL